MAPDVTVRKKWKDEQTIVGLVGRLKMYQDTIVGIIGQDELLVEFYRDWTSAQGLFSEGSLVYMQLLLTSSNVQKKQNK